MGCTSPSSSVLRRNQQCGGATRTPDYRDNVNEMGEVPVLVHGKEEAHPVRGNPHLSLRSTGKFKPQGEDERLEALRWIIFDNQKVNGYLGPYRFLRNFAKPAGDPAVMAFLKGTHRRQSRHCQQAARIARLPAG